jgi:phospholipid/cholesterol/gamma-HCH transport system ATP-binding protein
MSAPPKLEWIDVSKTLGGRRVLDGVSIDVAAGHSLVVIGGSGVGKSVTLKCALGILRPDGGQVRVDGEDVTTANREERSRIAAKFGMLFQGGALFDSLSIWENVAFRLLYAERTSRKQAKARAIETMRKVRLAPEFAERYPVELSGGMQKRASLARAIIAKPEIIFFDEPTTGLDPITADAINDLIIEMVKDLGCAAVSITHDMASARKIADEIAMLYNGKIIWRGRAGDIDQSGDPRVDQFINGRAEGPIQAIV